jgi:hypothetical protein
MAEKRKLLSATIGEDVLDAIKRVAEEERLTVSVLVDRILAEWLKARGFLKKVSRP